MNFIDVIGAPGPERQAIASLLRDQKFDVSERDIDAPLRPANLLVLHGPTIGDAALMDFARRAVEIAPTNVIVPAQLRGGDLVWTDFNDRKERFQTIGIDTLILETHIESHLVTGVRSMLIRRRPIHVHVLEDEHDWANMLERGLSDAGFKVTRSETLDGARAAFQAEPIDVFVVDRQLPGGADGLDFVRNLRRQRLLTPAIIFTIMDDPDSEREATDAGAHHFMSKMDDKSSNERMELIIARIRNSLMLSAQTDALVFGHLEIRLMDGVTRWRGERIPLPAKAQTLLSYLAERLGLAVPLEIIMADLWGRVYLSSSDLTAMERHAPAVARKGDVVRAFNAAGAPTPIDVIGSAYRFNPEPFLKLAEET